MNLYLQSRTLRPSLQTSTSEDTIKGSRKNVDLELPETSRGTEGGTTTPVSVCLGVGGLGVEPHTLDVTGTVPVDRLNDEMTGLLWVRRVAGPRSRVVNLKLWTS